MQALTGSGVGGRGRTEEQEQNRINTDGSEETPRAVFMKNKKAQI